MTTILAVVAATALAAAAVGLPLYLMARASARRSGSQTDAIIARMRERFGSTPALKPHVPLRIPDTPPEAELRIIIHRHPESGDAELPKIAARLIEEASRLERSLGGYGLRYDEAGSADEPTQLVLRLVPNRVDWEAPDRLEEVAGELNRRMQKAREATVRQQADDIRRKIERELHPPLPETIQDVEVAVTVAADEVPLQPAAATP